MASSWRLEALCLNHVSELRSFDARLLEQHHAAVADPNAKCEIDPMQQ